MESSVSRIMDTINHSNIDNMIYFYSFLLEKIVDMKHKIDRDLELFIEQGDIIKNCKVHVIPTPSIQDSDSETDSDDELIEE